MRIPSGFVQLEDYTYIEVNGTFTGRYAELFGDIAKRINVTFDLVESYDGNYGSQEEDSSWNGIIRVNIKILTFEWLK